MNPVQRPANDSLARSLESSDSPKRESILAAALELFGEQGFHGTTVPEVAARAKVAAGTIYRYYPSKEALVNALYQHWKTELGRSVFDNLPAGTFRQQFHAVWLRMARFAEAHPDAITFLEIQAHGSYLDEASRRCEEAVHRQACAFMEGARKGKALKRLPAEVLVSLVWGAFLGIVKASWSGSVQLTPQVLKDAEQCCWEAVCR